MKLNSTILLTAAALGASALVASAQDPAPAGSPAAGGQGGPGGPGGRRPNPIIAALDANGDGIIDKDEIANASKALLSLDKNGDGQLTPDEYRPQRGPGGPGGQGGAGGPGAGGPGGRRGGGGQAKQGAQQN